ncbi:minor tail protein [Gordonia phage Widow]|nr:minor tail protein [Gordonia phage Widow]
MRHILSGDVATRVPSPREAPTELPEPAVASSFVPALVSAPADLPRLTSVATKLPPAEVIVPTALPFWLRRLTAVLNAQAEIRVQVVAVELHGAEAIRGRAEIRPEVVGVTLPAGSRSIAGRGLISALATMTLPAGVRELAGRAQILMSAAMALPAGVRELGARAAISAAVQTITLAGGTRSLGARGAITVSGVSQALTIPVIRMVKTTTTAGSGTSYATLPGFVADAAYPYSEVDSGVALSVPDDWPSYTGTVRAEVPHTGGSSPRYGQTQIYQSGTLRVTGAQQTASPGTSTAEWTGTIYPGDYFVIQWRGEGNFFQRPTAQAGAFLQITPS